MATAKPDNHALYLKRLLTVLRNISIVGIISAGSTIHRDLHAFKIAAKNPNWTDCAASRVKNIFLTMEQNTELTVGTPIRAVDHCFR